MLEDGALRAVAGPDMVVLRTTVPLHGEGLRTVGEFAVAAGDEGCLHAGLRALAPAAAGADRPGSGARRHRSVLARLVEPLRTRGRMDGGRAALADHAEGADLPADRRHRRGATTSLPEQLGGARNWDYRFCWLRDATLTLLALMNAGYYDEARAWRDWLLRAVAGSPAQMQIMYGIAGERRLTEWEVPWLPGYEGSRPVRIGNAAHGQLQLDVYGEVMDALHQAPAWRARGPRRRLGAAAALLKHLETVWREPDEGIWEVRGAAAALHLLQGDGLGGVRSRGQGRGSFGLDGPVEHWRACATRSTTRSAGTASIPSWMPSSRPTAQGSSTRACCCCRSSASCRRRTRACAARSRRSSGSSWSTASCSATTRRRRTTGCRRARAPSSPAASGSPTPTSCWAAWTRRARLFERLLALRNDVGLLAEEYDPRRGRLVGNFPQAFSHLALVNTAHNLTRAAKPAEQRAERSMVSAGP